MILLVLGIALLVTAKLGKRYTLSVARNGRKAPREGVEGVLEEAGINEAVHELEENLARLRRLRANQRWDSRALRDSQVRAVKGRDKEGSGNTTLRIATSVDAECNRLAILKNLRERHGWRSIASRRGIRSRRRRRCASTRRRIRATTSGLKRDGRLKPLLRIREALDLGGQIRNGALSIGEALLDGSKKVIGIRCAHVGLV